MNEILSSVAANWIFFEKKALINSTEFAYTIEFEYQLK